MEIIAIQHQAEVPELPAFLALFRTMNFNKLVTYSMWQSFDPRAHLWKVVSVCFDK